MQVLDTTNAPPICFSSLAHRYSLQEFWEHPDPDDRSHYELIGGQLVMVPPPDAPHDDLDARIVKSLARFLIDRNIEGESLHPRASIYRDVADVPRTGHEVRFQGTQSADGQETQFGRYRFRISFPE
jgi:Uma2 family endonuclease